MNILYLKGTAIYHKIIVVTYVFQQNSSNGYLQLLVPESPLQQHPKNLAQEKINHRLSYIGNDS